MENFNLLKFSNILLDTNFFIDVFGHENKYAPFFQEIKRTESTLVSIDFVRCEFIRSKTIETLLPTDASIHALAQSTIEEYGVDSEGVDPVDLYLACFLKRYKSLFLLTRNHQHFPQRIFTRNHIFNVELAKEIRTYALYQYKPGRLEIEAQIPTQ